MKTKQERNRLNKVKKARQRKVWLRRNWLSISLVVMAMIWLIIVFTTL